MIIRVPQLPSVLFMYPKGQATTYSLRPRVRYKDPAFRQPHNAIIKERNESKFKRDLQIYINEVKYIA